MEEQDHLEGSKRPDMFSARMGTWNLVEISRAMFVILRQRTRPILRHEGGGGQLLSLGPENKRQGHIHQRRNNNIMIASVMVCVLKMECNASLVPHQRKGSLQGSRVFSDFLG